MKEGVVCVRYVSYSLIAKCSRQSVTTENVSHKFLSSAVCAPFNPFEWNLRIKLAVSLDRLVEQLHSRNHALSREIENLINSFDGSILFSS